MSDFLNNQYIKVLHATNNNSFISFTRGYVDSTSINSTTIGRQKTTCVTLYPSLHPTKLKLVSTFCNFYATIFVNIHPITIIFQLLYINNLKI